MLINRPSIVFLFLFFLTLSADVYRTSADSYNRDGIISPTIPANYVPARKGILPYFRSLIFGDRKKSDCEKNGQYSAYPKSYEYPNNQLNENKPERKKRSLWPLLLPLVGLGKKNKDKSNYPSASVNYPTTKSTSSNPWRTRSSPSEYDPKVGDKKSNKKRLGLLLGLIPFLRRKGNKDKTNYPSNQEASSPWRTRSTASQDTPTDMINDKVKEKKSKRKYLLLPLLAIFGRRNKAKKVSQISGPKWYKPSSWLKRSSTPELDEDGKEKEKKKKSKKKYLLLLLPFMIKHHRKHHKKEKQVIDDENMEKSEKQSSNWLQRRKRGSDGSKKGGLLGLLALTRLHSKSKSTKSYESDNLKVEKKRKKHILLFPLLFLRHFKHSKKTSSTTALAKSGNCCPKKSKKKYLLTKIVHLGLGFGLGYKIGSHYGHHHHDKSSEESTTNIVNNYDPSKTSMTINKGGSSSSSEEDDKKVDIIKKEEKSMGKDSDEIVKEKETVKVIKEADGDVKIVKEIKKVEADGDVKIIKETKKIDADGDSVTTLETTKIDPDSGEYSTQSKTVINDLNMDDKLPSEAYQYKDGEPSPWLQRKISEDEKSGKPIDWLWLYKKYKNAASPSFWRSKGIDPSMETTTNYGANSMDPGMSTNYGSNSIDPGMSSDYKMNSMDPGMSANYGSYSIDPGMSSDYKMNSNDYNIEEELPSEAMQYEDGQPSAWLQRKVNQQEEESKEPTDWMLMYRKYKNAASPSYWLSKGIDPDQVGEGRWAAEEVPSEGKVYEPGKSSSWLWRIINRINSRGEPIDWAYMYKHYKDAASPQWWQTQGINTSTGQWQEKLEEVPQTAYQYQPGESSGWLKWLINKYKQEGRVINYGWLYQRYGQTASPEWWAKQGVNTGRSSWWRMPKVSIPQSAYAYRPGGASSWLTRLVQGYRNGGQRIDWNQMYRYYRPTASKEYWQANGVDTQKMDAEMPPETVNAVSETPKISSEPVITNTPSDPVNNDGDYGGDDEDDDDVGGGRSRNSWLSRAANRIRQPKPAE